MKKFVSPRLRYVLVNRAGKPTHIGFSFDVCMTWWNAQRKRPRLILNDEDRAQMFEDLKRSGYSIRKAIVTVDIKDAITKLPKERAHL